MGADIIDCNFKFRIYKVLSYNIAQQTKGLAEMSALIWESNIELQKADGFNLNIYSSPLTSTFFKIMSCYLLPQTKLYIQETDFIQGD